MTGILLIVAALVCAMIGSELALRGTKLQTGLSRVLVVWGGVYLVGVYPECRWGFVGPIAFTLCWGGAFLSWFGVRSHVESSILLRMLYWLRRQPMGETQILEDYEAYCGHSVRVEELLRGGLAVKTAGRLSVTPKGKKILGVVSKLR